MLIVTLFHEIYMAWTGNNNNNNNNFYYYIVFFI